MNERLLSSQNASCSRPVSKALSSHMNVYKPVVRRRSVHVNSKERDIVVPAASIELQAPTQPSINCHTLVDDSLAVDIDEGKIITRFVAETLLPTKHGRFRLRGYKHSVRLVHNVFLLTWFPSTSHIGPYKGPCLQADGGLTFTEPAAIICGQVENGEDVGLSCGTCTTSRKQILMHCHVLFPGSRPCARCLLYIRWVAWLFSLCLRSSLTSKPLVDLDLGLTFLPLSVEVLGSLKCDCAQQLSLALEKIHKSQYGIVIYLQQEGRGIGLANKIAAYSLQVKSMRLVE